MRLGWEKCRVKGSGLKCGGAGGGGENNNQDLRKLLDLFLISTLPLIYTFPFAGPSDGPPLLPASPHPTPVCILQHLKSLKKILHPLTMFSRGYWGPLFPGQAIAMETFYPAVGEGCDLPQIL